MPTWEEFLATDFTHINTWEFLVNLVLAGVLSFILSLVYVRYGYSLSNRSIFSRNFVILGMTTMLIITVIKSSLALALGLVGALSIVRFRAAIKEPEELVYLFVAIAVGVGLGANQRLITIIAVLVIVLLIIARKKFGHKRRENQNLHLTISSHNPGRVELQQIVTILKNHCSSVNMRRFDETNEVLEASFLVEFHDYEEFEKLKSELRELSKGVKITFLDYQGTY